MGGYIYIYTTTTTTTAAAKASSHEKLFFLSFCCLKKHCILLMFEDFETAKNRVFDWENDDFLHFQKLLDMARL